MRVMLMTDGSEGPQGLRQAVPWTMEATDE
jgi:hypothetical protein